MGGSVSRRKFLIGSLAGGVSVVGARLPSVHAARKQIRILFTNDTHGHLKPVYHRDWYGPEFLREHGIPFGSETAYLTSFHDYERLARRLGKVGGFAHLATAINRERAAMPDRTLLVDAGDTWYGSALALFTAGKAVVEAMNLMGYDAMTLHWELNLGREHLLARVRDVRFPVLAQNLVDTDFEDAVLPQYLVKELGGVRIGIIGQAYQFGILTTEDPDLTEGWRMGYRSAALVKLVKRLRTKEKVDLVVLLSHMGHPQEVAFAAQVAGIDVIVGGHTHDVVYQPVQVGRTLVLQAGSHGKFLGELDLELSSGKIVDYRHRLIPILAERIEPDPQVSRVIEEAYRPYLPGLKRVVGESETLLYRHALLQSPTDSLIAEAYREIGNADVGTCPGWRFGTTILPGEITVEDVYNAMKPTPSHLFVPQLRGFQIKALVEDTLDNVFNIDPLLRLGGNMFRFVGMRVWFKRKNPKGARVVQIELGGRALDSQGRYRIATSGGRIQRLAVQMGDTGKVAVEALIRYIGERSPIRSGVLTNIQEG